MLRVQTRERGQERGVNIQDAHREAVNETVVEEKIYRDAGGATSGNLRRGELLRLIREAGREPVERDTLYRPVERTESTFTVLV
jgi:aminodeoxyfutalosine synthase